MTQNMKKIFRIRKTKDNSMKHNLKIQRFCEKFIHVRLRCLYNEFFSCKQVVFVILYLFK